MAIDWGTFVASVSDGLVNRTEVENEKRQEGMDFISKTLLPIQQVKFESQMRNTLAGFNLAQTLGEATRANVLQETHEEGEGARFEKNRYNQLHSMFKANVQKKINTMVTKGPDGKDVTAEDITVALNLKNLLDQNDVFDQKSKNELNKINAEDIAAQKRANTQNNINNLYLYQQKGITDKDLEQVDSYPKIEHGRFVYDSSGNVVTENITLGQFNKKMETVDKISQSLTLSKNVEAVDATVRNTIARTDLITEDQILRRKQQEYQEAQTNYVGTQDELLGARVTEVSTIANLTKNMLEGVEAKWKRKDKLTPKDLRDVEETLENLSKLVRASQGQLNLTIFPKLLERVSDMEFLQAERRRLEKITNPSTQEIEDLSDISRRILEAHNDIRNSYAAVNQSVQVEYDYATQFYNHKAALVNMENLRVNSGLPPTDWGKLLGTTEKIDLDSLTPDHLEQLNLITNRTGGRNRTSQSGAFKTYNNKSSTNALFDLYTGIKSQTADGRSVWVPITVDKAVSNTMHYRNTPQSESNLVRYFGESVSVMKRDNPYFVEKWVEELGRSLPKGTEKLDSVTQAHYESYDEERKEKIVTKTKFSEIPAEDINQKKIILAQAYLEETLDNIPLEMFLTHGGDGVLSSVFGHIAAHAGLDMTNQIDSNIWREVVRETIEDVEDVLKQSPFGETTGEGQSGWKYSDGLLRGQGTKGLSVFKEASEDAGLHQKEWGNTLRMYNNMDHTNKQLIKRYLGSKHLMSVVPEPIAKAETSSTYGQHWKEQQSDDPTITTLKEFTTSETFGKGLDADDYDNYLKDFQDGKKSTMTLKGTKANFAGADLLEIISKQLSKSYATFRSKAHPDGGVSERKRAWGRGKIGMALDDPDQYNALQEARNNATARHMRTIEQSILEMWPDEGRQAIADQRKDKNFGMFMSHEGTFMWFPLEKTTDYEFFIHNNRMYNWNEIKVTLPNGKDRTFLPGEVDMLLWKQPYGQFTHSAVSNTSKKYADEIFGNKTPQIQ